MHLFMLQGNYNSGAHVTLCAAHYNMHVMITHITGTDNCIADFPNGSLAPYANPHADAILALAIPSSANYKNAAST